MNLLKPEKNVEVVQRYSVEKVFLEISQNLLSCEFCEISNNTFSYRTPPVAASDNSSLVNIK